MAYERRRLSIDSTIDGRERRTHGQRCRMYELQFALECVRETTSNHLGLAAFLAQEHSDETCAFLSYFRGLLEIGQPL